VGYLALMTLETGICLLIREDISYISYRWAVVLPFDREIKTDIFTDAKGIVKRYTQSGCSSRRRPLAEVCQ